MSEPDPETQLGECLELLGYALGAMTEMAHWLTTPGAQAEPYDFHYATVDLPERIRLKLEESRKANP